MKPTVGLENFIALPAIVVGWGIVDGSYVLHGQRFSLLQLVLSNVTNMKGGQLHLPKAEGSGVSDSFTLHESGTPSHSRILLQALNDRARLNTSYANQGRAYTVQNGTCQFPDNFTGCQDLARRQVRNQPAARMQSSK